VAVACAGSLVQNQTACEKSVCVKAVYLCKGCLCKRAGSGI
jgi:hypothetical protein